VWLIPAKRQNSGEPLDNTQGDSNCPLIFQRHSLHHFLPPRFSSYNLRRPTHQPRSLLTQHIAATNFIHPTATETPSLTDQVHQRDSPIKQSSSISFSTIPTHAYTLFVLSTFVYDSSITTLFKRVASSPAPSLDLGSNDESTSPRSADLNRRIIADPLLFSISTDQHISGIISSK
jgi:hypothetical protein